jgi:hypothetical protein
MKITIGTDPELFVKKDGEFHSAHGLVAGTKYEPQVVNKGAVQVDGMALEFNTDPASSFDEFNTNINTVLTELRALVPKEFEFCVTPTATFTKEHMEQQPEEALELGCEPDYCAYTGKANIKPNAEQDFRTGAGHVHIGVDKKLSEFEKRRLVVLCDLFIGLPSLKWDSDKKRRSMYGKAGCYRSKPYGIEYRTPSNVWLKTRANRKKVYDGAVRAVNNLSNFEKIIKDVESLLDLYFDDDHHNHIQYIINTSHKNMRDKLIERVEKYV